MAALSSATLDTVGPPGGGEIVHYNLSGDVQRTSALSEFPPGRAGSATREAPGARHGPSGAGACRRPRGLAGTARPAYLGAQRTSPGPAGRGRR